MTGLLNGQRGEWSAKWRMMCEGLDPLAPADENRLADIARAGPIISTTCATAGCAFFSLGRFVLPGDMAGAPRCNSSRGRMSMLGRRELWQAGGHANAGMLRSGLIITARVVKGFYKNHFLRFDRQIVWWIACNLSTVGHRHLMICVWH